VDDSEQEDIVTHINPMRVLNCLVAELQDSVVESSCRTSENPARRPRPGDGGFFSLLLELILLGVAT